MKLHTANQCKTQHRSNFIFVLTFILSLSLYPLSLQAQLGEKKDYVEILQAGSLESVRQGEQKLVGNVRLKQGAVILACDSAFIYEKSNDFYAYGRVFMNKKDSVKIYCDVMKYYGEKKFTVFTGHVRMYSDKTILETDVLYYENEKNYAYYLNGAKIKEDKTKIYSKKGYFDTPKHLINFKGNVKIENVDFTIFSDTLDYNTETKITTFKGPSNIYTKTGKIYCEDGFFDDLTKESIFKKNARVIEKSQIITAEHIYRNSKTLFSEAFTNVRVVDTTEKVVITGNHGTFNEKTGRIVMTENALLEQLIDGDTLFLHADTLRAINDTIRKEKKVFAYYGVRFYRKDMQGACDSMTYFPSDSLIRLYQNPVIWSGESQITGNYIEIVIYDSKIHEMHIQKNGFIISENGPDAYDQIKGRDMIGYFEKSKMKKMKVNGNAQTIYFIKEKDGSYVGANQAQSSSLTITFKDNKASKIKFYTKPDAIFHPIEKVDVATLKLENFTWRSEERPLNKNDLFRKPSSK